MPESETPPAPSDAPVAPDAPVPLPLSPPLPPGEGRGEGAPAAESPTPEAPPPLPSPPAPTAPTVPCRYAFGLPAALPGPGDGFWESIAPAELEGLGGRARAAHDADRLLLFVELAGAAGAGGAGGAGEALVVTIGKPGGAWTFRVGAGGEARAEAPAGAPLAEVRFAARAQTVGSAWHAALEVPFGELAPPAEAAWGVSAAGTPIEGESWALALEASGRRWSGRIAFAGGAREARIRPGSRVEVGYGVSRVEFALSGAKAYEVRGAVDPAPAARTRTKDATQVKMRLTRPGAYRVRAKVAETPPEGEGATGRPGYSLTVAFALPDVWGKIEEMERTVAAWREAAGARGLAISAEAAQAVEYLERMIAEADRYRSVHAKERMEPGLAETLGFLHGEVGKAFEALLGAPGTAGPSEAAPLPPAPPPAPEPPPSPSLGGAQR